VCPAAGVDLPDAGVRFVGTLGDRFDQSRDRAATIVGESPEGVGSRQELEGLALGVVL
jgi:hypothetical protein